MKKPERKNSENKRQRWTVGSIVEIPLEGYYAYGQLLKPDNIGFYDKKYDSPIEDITELETVPFLFVQYVCSSPAITQGYWRKIGKLPIKAGYETMPMEFIQDSIKKDRFFLYNPNTAESKPCKREDIEGLNRCAISYQNHIEDRLNAYFLGVYFCQWEEKDYKLFGKYIP